MARIFPIEIDQGATFPLKLDIESEVDGSKFDVSDWTFTGSIRDTFNAATASAEFTIAVITAASGSVQVQLPASRTNTLVPGNKVYDIEMASGSVVIRLLEGPVKVNPQVTQ